MAFANLFSPKILVRGPRVLKVFPGVFIYIYMEKIKKSQNLPVQTGQQTPSVIDNFRNFPIFFQMAKKGLNIALIQKIRAHLIISFKENFRKWSQFSFLFHNFLSFFEFVTQHRKKNHKHAITHLNTACHAKMSPFYEISPKTGN